MVLKRGGRKQYKKRKQAKRANKVKGMRPKYADTHSFKLQSIDTTIYNQSNAGIILPTASGGTFIGSPNTQPNGTMWFGGSFNFLVSNALQWNQLNTLFDRVKVTGIKVKVIPTFNVNTAALGVIPTMRMVYDYDDNSTPAVGDVWSRRGVERRLNKPFSVYLKPKVLAMLFGTGITSIPSPKETQFMNCASAATVPLLGLKYAIKDWPIGLAAGLGGGLVRFEITYYVTFKEQIQVQRTLGEEPAQAPTAEDEEDIACENKPPV